MTATTDHTLYPYFVNENEVLVTFDYGAGSGRELTRALEKNDAIGALPEAQPPLNGALFGWFAGETQIDETFVVNVENAYKTALFDRRFRADEKIHVVYGYVPRKVNIGSGNAR